MPINFQRLKSGQPWSITQTTADAIIESAENWAKHKRDGEDADPPEYLYQGNIIQIKNASGYTMPRFSVAGLDAALITPAQNLNEFQNYPRLSGRVPLAADSGGFCILLEPLVAGAIGLAMVSGVAPVQLYRYDGDTQPSFADVAAGQIGWLTGASGSGAGVLWCDQLTSSSPNYHPASAGGPAWGTPWALVRLPESGMPLPTNLILNSDGCQPNNTFTLASPSGLCFTGPQAGLPLAPAQIALLTLSVYSDPCVKFLAAGLWDMELEWSTSNYYNSNSQSGGYFPRPFGATGQITPSLANSPGGQISPDDSWGVRVAWWETQNGDNAFSSITPAIPNNHRHYLLDVPTGALLSVQATIAQEFANGYGTMQILDAAMRLCRIGDSQVGYT